MEDEARGIPQDSAYDCETEHAVLEDGRRSSLARLWFRLCDRQPDGTVRNERREDYVRIASDVVSSAFMAEYGEIPAPHNQMIMIMHQPDYVQLGFSDAAPLQEGR